MKDTITVADLIRCAKEASRIAVQKSKDAKGILTYQEGNSIIKEYPDGTKRVIEVLEKVYVIPKQFCFKI